MLGAMKQMQYDAVSNTVTPYWFYNVGPGYTGAFADAETIDSSNNIYLGGTYNSTTTYSIWLAKYNSIGVLQWMYFYGNPTSPYAGPRDVTGMTNDGTFLYVLTSTNGYTSSFNGMQILKVSMADGSLQQTNYWNTVPSSFSTTEYGITLAPDGNLIISNGASNTNYGGLISMTKGGAINWTAVSGQTGLTRYAVSSNPAVSSTNVSYVCAADSTSSGSNVQVRLNSYSSSGVANWAKVINGYNVNTSSLQSPGGETSVAMDSSDNVYVTVNNTTTGSPVKGSTLLKFDSTGAVVWQRVLQANTGASVSSYSMTIDSSDNIYVLNTYSITTPLSFSTLIAKYNTSGDLVWQRRLATDDLGTDGYAKTIKTNTNGNIVIGVDPGAYSRFATVSLPADGSLTGTFVIGNVYYTYSDFTVTSNIASNLKVTTGTTSSGSYTATNFSNISVSTANVVSVPSSTILYLGN